MYYDKDRQLHKLFPFTTGINLVLLYQQKEEKKITLKLLHHLVPVNDAEIEKLVFSGRSSTFTAKKKKDTFHN